LLKNNSNAYKLIVYINLLRMSTVTLLQRSKLGYQRSNGRWEARYRPQTKVKLLEDEFIASAFKGHIDGVYKYEFLE
jgi:hypothetical protein